MIFSGAARTDKFTTGLFAMNSVAGNLALGRTGSLGQEWVVLGIGNVEGNGVTTPSLTQ